jgi:hypothetical protein
MVTLHSGEILIGYHTKFVPTFVLGLSAVEKPYLVGLYEIFFERCSKWETTDGIKKVCRKMPVT